MTYLSYLHIHSSFKKWKFELLSPAIFLKLYRIFTITFSIILSLQTDHKIIKSSVLCITQHNVRCYYIGHENVKRMHSIIRSTHGVLRINRRQQDLLWSLVIRKRSRTYLVYILFNETNKTYLLKCQLYLEYYDWSC